MLFPLLEQLSNNVGGGVDPGLLLNMSSLHCCDDAPPPTDDVAAPGWEVVPSSAYSGKSHYVQFIITHWKNRRILNF